VTILRDAASISVVVAVALLGSTGIRQIDFKNFDYPLAEESADDPAPTIKPWKWFSGDARSTLRLVNGRHDFTTPDGLSDGYLLHSTVTYGDLDGDGEDEAAVDLLRGTGGTENWHYLYVFTLANGSPRLVGTLMSGSRAYGGLVNVEIVRGILSLDFQDEDRREGDCCSRGIIRVRYRFHEGQFIELGRRERDSVRVVSYPLFYPKGPETVRQELNGDRNDIVYTDAEGKDRKLTASGGDEPNLSSDKRSVVFLRKLNQNHQNNTEIWTVQTDGSGARLLYNKDVRWNGRGCPSSTFRSPQWSDDGRSVYFVSDCTLMTGALWQLDVASRAVRPLISDAVMYGVIRTGRFKGYLLANKRTTLSADGCDDSYPVYLFFLFTADGKVLQQVGDEFDQLEELLPEWNGR
jgi:hypothetical protein